MEERTGPFFDSYDGTIRLVETLHARNPGTCVKIQHLWLPEFPIVTMWHRLFFSSAICIEAFRHYRLVLYVPRTFLTRKYKGQILAAVGTSRSRHIIPLAMTFVEGENFESWLWLFTHLKVTIVKDWLTVCIFMTCMQVC
jgi:hypothetical protein